MLFGCENLIVMNINHHREALPTYHEVLQEERNIERRLWCLRIIRVGFLIADALISILVIGGFLLLFFTDIFVAYHYDIKQYCDDPHFNVTPIPEASNSYMYVAVSLMIATCISLSIVKNKVENGKLNTTVIWEIWIVVMNLVILYVIIEFLKCAAGVPRPYFFGDSNLKKYYCDANQTKKSYSIPLEQIDDDYRKSFPSRRAAFSVFSVSFLYFYFGHYDIRVGPHSIQHLLLLITGPSIYYFLSRSLERGENHLSDILVGAIIGMCEAVLAIRSIHSRILSTPPVVPERPARFVNYYNPTIPPEVLVEDVTPMVRYNANMRHIDMSRYESAQSLAAAGGSRTGCTVIDIDENGDDRIQMDDADASAPNPLINTNI